MRPLAHAVTSGVISTFVWIHFRSFGCAALSFVAGVFIDLDHLFDYFSHYRFTLNVGRIYRACARSRFRKLYLLLHSYEIVALFWAAIYVFSLSNAWKAVAIGITQHLIFDQLTNPLNRYGYFFTYRLMVGFRKKDLITSRHRSAVKIGEQAACPH